MEYVGSFDGVIPASAETGAIRQVGYDGGERIIGRYVGSPDYRDIRSGYLGWDPYHWHSGRVTVQCFAHPAEGRRFTASVKGIGERGPPTAASAG